MSWLLWIGVGLFVAAAVDVVVLVVGRESHERRGVLRFDTPGARSALRRCNPARDVHYFDGAHIKCQCGEREVFPGLQMPEVRMLDIGLPTIRQDDQQ